MYRNPDFDMLEDAWGIHTSAVDYVKPEWKQNFRLAMDAQPTLITTPNSGIPAFLTTIIDPQILKVLLAPNKAATIFGEVKKGTWLDQTAMFPIKQLSLAKSTATARS